MKYFLLLAIVCAFPYYSNAQVQFNPQVGVTIQNLSKPPAGVDYKGAAGFKIGADFRLGKRLYFQPGIFYDQSATVIKYTNADTVEIKDNLVRSSLDLKALVGYKIVSKDGFKLRLMGGPSFDFLLNMKNKDSKSNFSKNDFSNGTFNLDAGVGVDIWFLTGEIGYRYGLTNAYKDNNNKFSNADSKYLAFYFSLGLVFGSGL